MLVGEVGVVAAVAAAAEVMLATKLMKAEVSGSAMVFQNSNQASRRRKKIIIQQTEGQQLD